jgi:ATP-dependent DNA helicase RecG
VVNEGEETTSITTQETTPITTQESAAFIGETTTQETTPITTQETTPIVEDHRLLLLIASDPQMTQAALAAALGMTRDGAKYHINKLKQEGVIRRVGSTRSGYWKVLK